MKQTGIAIIGFGVAGGGTVRQLQEERQRIQARFGIDPVIRHVVVRNPAKARSVQLEQGELHADLDRALADPAVDIVLELIGGITAARTVVEKALAAGKHVVTANKALLADCGESLFAQASQAGRIIAWEASVCAGIPLIRGLADGLAGDRIISLQGIVNGTSNFILTRMSEDGQDFAGALDLARQAGLAEADPGLDVDGHDAAHKIALLARLAFGMAVPQESVWRRGIRGIAPIDIQRAASLDCCIRLVASATLAADGQLDIRVEPALLPRKHPLAAVRDEFNAVLVESAWLGLSLFQAKGAGEAATANSIVADLIEIARTGEGSPTGNRWPPLRPGSVRPATDFRSAWYVRLELAEHRLALAETMATIGAAGISVASLHQPEEQIGTLVLFTHPVGAGQLENALASLCTSGLLRAPALVLRRY